MRKAFRLCIIISVAWLVTVYGHALSVMAKGEKESSRTLDTSGKYWSPDPTLSESEGRWDSKVWKWREFLGCGSVKANSPDTFNFARWSTNHSAEMGMLTSPDLDWVYVSGMSVGSVWDDLTPTYQPNPLNVISTDSMHLETRIADWKGAPLSPIIFPSWYAVLTDVWFNVTNVVIENENGREHFPSKILGMDVFYHTMTGNLNAVMGAGNEFSRIEPCNSNFIYSVNLAGQDFYSLGDDGVYVIDMLALLRNAQQQAEAQGWHFKIEDVELVMLENVVESYWSYAYAKIGWSGVRYCLHDELCAIE